VPNAVQVARFGTGNSTATVVTITQTADEFVSTANKGFFQIQLDINGVIHQSKCLPYHNCRCCTGSDQ